MSFDELLEYEGREIEFYYENNKYSISVCRDGIWYLTKYGDHENAQEFKSSMDLIHNATIDNILIKEICENFEIDVIY